MPSMGIGNVAIVSRACEVVRLPYSDSSRTRYLRRMYALEKSVMDVLNNSGV